MVQVRSGGQRRGKGVEPLKAWQQLTAHVPRGHARLPHAQGSRGPHDRPGTSSEITQIHGRMV